MDAAFRLVCGGGYELDGVFGGDGNVGEILESLLACARQGETIGLFLNFNN
ncbi:MAG: hypothetical protein WKF59_10590 [Chitinophagaceae bacterium]